MVSSRRIPLVEQYSHRHWLTYSPPLSVCRVPTCLLYWFKNILSILINQLTKLLLCFMGDTHSIPDISSMSVVKYTLPATVGCSNSPHRSECTWSKHLEAQGWLDWNGADVILACMHASHTKPLVSSRSWTTMPLTNPLFIILCRTLMLGCPRCWWIRSSDIWVGLWAILAIGGWGHKMWRLYKLPPPFDLARTLPFSFRMWLTPFLKLTSNPQQLSTLTDRSELESAGTWITSSIVRHCVTNAPLFIPHYRNDKLYWAIYATKDEGKKGVDLFPQSFKFIYYLHVVY